MRHSDGHLLCSALLCSASGLTLLGATACGTRAEQSQNQDQKLTEEVTPGPDEVMPGEVASPPLVALRWRGAAEQESSAAVAALEVEVENTMDAAVDVTLTAVGQGPERDVATVLDTVSVPAKGKRSQAIGVDALPVQLVDGSVPTVIGAKYAGPDGREYSSVLPTRWITHEPGYGKARVRAAAAEARANASRSFKDLFRAPAVGREIQPDTGRLADLPARSGAVGSRFMTFAPASLPALRDTDFSSLTRHSPEENSDEPIEKAGNYNICLKVPYMYMDANMGEDRLKNGYTPSTIAYEPARYMGVRLCDQFGNCPQGYLNSSGCTGPIYHPNGDYWVGVVPIVYRGGANDMFVGVFRNGTEKTNNEYTWFARTYTISGSGGTLTFNLSGDGELTNVALPVATSAWLMPSAFRGGEHYFLTQVPCTDLAYDICSYGLATYLNGQVYQKYTVLHELAHRVHAGLYGTPEKQYTASVTEPMCRCDHVTGNNEEHCLQSREYIWAAQIEGFANFFASDVFNIWNQEDCTFVNFKETLADNGGTISPPWAVSCVAQNRWMETHCAYGNRGTEWDWMNFYWYLNNKVDFSYDDFEDTYEQACGGTCDSNDDDELKWSNMLDAVEAKLPADLDDWVSAGGLYGVDD